MEAGAMKLSTASLPNRQSLKYILFDLTVISLIIVAAVRTFLGDEFSDDGCLSFFVRPSSESNEEVVAVSASGDTSNGTSEQEEEPTTRQLRKKSSSSVQQQQQDEYENFKINDYVEVYDPKILKHTAFFARIVSITTSLEEQVENNDKDTSSSSSSTSVKFQVRAGPDQDETHYDIDISNIKPHSQTTDSQHYEFNTPAICDFGHSLHSNKKLFPCTILAPVMSGKLLTYYVLGMKNGQEMYFQLPLYRVRKLMVPPSIATAEGIRDELEHGDDRWPDPMKEAKDGSSSASNPSDHMEEATDYYKSYPNPNILRGIVQITDGTSKFSQPAIVIGYSKRDDAYDIHLTVTNEQGRGVSPKLVHPYKIYPNGTRGLCNLIGYKEVSYDPSSKNYIIPCYVHSHRIDKKDGKVWYNVSYDSEDGQKGFVVLPFTKIWRQNS